MERRDFIQWLLSIPVAGTALLAGCGGGSGSSAGGGVKATRGFVKMPAGSAIPVGLTVETGLGSSLVASDGTFAVNTNSSAVSPTLSWVRSGETIVYLGFLSSSNNTIDPVSTAVALIYLSLGGFTTPVENKQSLLDLLKQHPAVSAFSTAIAQRTAANPLAISQGDAAFATAFRTASNAILAERPTRAASPKLKTRDATSALLQINPTGLQSNLEVNQGAPAQSFLATNHSRRWCKVYVYETGTQAKDGTLDRYAKSKLLLPTVSLGSTRALGIKTSIFGFFKGDSTFTPVTTDPYTLNMADRMAKTNFETVILGSSSSLSDPGFFSDPRYADELAHWNDDLVALNLISWLGDVLFGLLLEIWGLTDIVRNEVAIVKAIANFRSIEIVGWSLIMELAGKGKFLDAITEFLAFSSKNADIAVRIRAAMAPLIPSIVGSSGAAEAAAGAKVCLKMFLSAFAAADLVLGAVDMGAVLYDLSHAERGEIWQDVLVKQDVRISPVSTEYNPGDSLLYYASVPAGAGQNVKYIWSVVSAFAVLTDTKGGFSGKSFETSSSSVSLVTTPSDQSDITVMVEAFSIATDGTRRSLGVAVGKATKHVSKNAPYGTVDLTFSNSPGPNLDPTLFRELPIVRAHQTPPSAGAVLPIIIESSHELFAGGQAQDTQFNLSLNFGNQISSGQQISLDFAAGQKLSIRAAGPTTGGATVRFIAVSGSFKVLSTSILSPPSLSTMLFSGTAVMVGQDDPTLTFTCTFNGWLTDMTMLA